MKKLLMTLGLMLSSVAVFAQEAAEAVASDVGGGASWIKAFYVIGMGIAVLGGALGQGKAISAALEGISRNPSANGQIFTAMIIGLALIESLVIFVLITVFIV